MIENAAAPKDGNTHNVDVAAMIGQLRQLRPTVWLLIADLVCTASGYVLYRLFTWPEVNMPDVPAFVVICSALIFVGFAKFSDHLSLRLHLDRILRNCKASG